MVRRANAYKLVPKELGQVQQVKWNDQSDISGLELPLTNSSSVELINIQNYTVWELVHRPDILDCLLSRSTSRKARFWSELWWYVFTEATVRIHKAPRGGRLELQALDRVVAALPVPSRTVLCQLDMLPTYKVIYISLLQSLPPCVALKATQHYIMRGEEEIIIYRPDKARRPGRHHPWSKHYKHQCQTWGTHSTWGIFCHMCKHLWIRQITWIMTGRKGYRTSCLSQLRNWGTQSKIWAWGISCHKHLWIRLKLKT